MQCTAMSKQSHEQCKRPATPGATVCKSHGSKAPQVQAKAAERVLELRLNGELQKRGWEPVQNPEQALLDVAGEVLAWLELCRSRLALLATLDYENDKADQDVRPVVALYERAQERAVGTLHKLVSLGIQDRVARSQELTAEANLQALRGLIRAARASEASEDELLLGMLGGAL